MTLTLDQLSECGLPIDWMTVKVGYEGIEWDWDIWHVPRYEIMDYALDLLASAVGTPDEYPIFLLADADADPTNRMALNNPLELLAERSGVTRETALRKWRYADIHKYFHTFQTPSDIEAADYWEDDEYHSIDYLKRQWNELISAHPLPKVAEKGNWEAIVLAEIALLRAWLSEEYLTLQ